MHKKLNSTIKLCPEFSKGFCSLAEKCNLRHDLPNTIVHKRQQRVQPGPATTAKNPEKSQKTAKITVKDPQRYYDGKDEDEETSNVPKRTKLGKLPSFIAI